MEKAPPEEGNAPIASPLSLASRLGNYAADALRYWEGRRPLYNAVLTLVVLIHLAAAWSAAREKLNLDLVLGLFLLSVLANICYCIVYPVDLFVQFAGLRTAWDKGRVVLFAIGTAFAATITHFLSKGLFANK
jgi:hypothetical protein